MPATIASVNVSPTGGVPKRPVLFARVCHDVVEGDKQINLKYHGGPMRAVCLYSLERIEALRDEGHPIGPGTTGENLTVRGLDWDSVVPGVRLTIGGGVELEITQFTVPCSKIGPSFIRMDSTRIGQPQNPGWARVYAKVLSAGVVHVGDPVTLSVPAVDASLENA